MKGLSTRMAFAIAIAVLSLWHPAGANPSKVHQKTIVQATGTKQATALVHRFPKLLVRKIRSVAVGSTYKANTQFGDLAVSDKKSVKGSVRSVKIGNLHYPDTSLFIPNSFVSSPEQNFHSQLRYINRVRAPANTFGCQPDCSDGEVYFEIDILNRDTYSLTLQPVVQSLSSRNNGTTLGQGLYLGFRFSKQLSETLSFSVGGETLKRFDSTTDLGRNAYLGFSKALSVGDTALSNVIVNLGLGSGGFSLFGNRSISTGFRRDRPDTIGDANNFDFGVVGSVAYLHSPRLSIGLEYSGYGVGFGPSIRPFQKLPLVATFYIYDLLWVPPMPSRDQVRPNLLANITYTF